MDQLVLAEQLKQYGNAFAGDRLDQALDAFEGGVFEADRGTGLHGADVSQLSVVSLLFELLDGLHCGVFDNRGLKTESDDGHHAARGAGRCNGQRGAGGPEENVAREHGLEAEVAAAWGAFEVFVQRQIGVKALLLQIQQGDRFLFGFGVNQIPVVTQNSECAPVGCTPPCIIF